MFLFNLLKQFDRSSNNNGGLETGSRRLPENTYAAILKRFKANIAVRRAAEQLLKRDPC